jgi:hypothetical protein
MGFFDKLKSIVGITGVKLEYTWVENPWPYKDPMIKATLTVTAGKDPVTIIGTKGTFYAKRTVNNVEERIVLGTDISNEEKCSRVERNGEYVKEFPQSLAAGEQTSYGFFIMDMNAPKSLTVWGGDTPENAVRNGITFFIEGEVDVKETFDLFDPTKEVQITVK